MRTTKLNKEFKKYTESNIKSSLNILSNHQKTLSDKIISLRKEVILSLI